MIEFPLTFKFRLRYIFQSITCITSIQVSPQPVDFGESCYPSERARFQPGHFFKMAA